MSLDDDTHSTLPNSLPNSLPNGKSRDCDVRQVKGSNAFWIVDGRCIVKNIQTGAAMRTNDGIGGLRGRRLQLAITVRA